MALISNGRRASPNRHPGRETHDGVGPGEVGLDRDLNWKPIVPALAGRACGRIVALLATGFLVSGLLTSSPGQSQSGPLHVVAVGSEPFVIDSETGPEGLSIDVWRAVVAELGLEAELETVASISQALDMVAEGEADVAVGPISITSDRAQRVAFTQPYFYSNLAILAPAAGSLFDRFAPFLTTAFITSAIGLVAVLILVGTLMWFAERKHNPEQFSKSPVSGIGNGVWMALVTMTTVGYGDRVPVSPIGRTITGVWMLISLVIASSLTAFLATAMTLSQMEGGAIERAEELRGRAVGVVGGTTSETFARDAGARTVAVADVDEALTVLADGVTEAVVFDRPMLRYALAQRPDLRFQISEASYQAQNYGFATRLNSPLADEVGLSILRLQESGELGRIEEAWLGR